jgi:hypothetical protein
MEKTLSPERERKINKIIDQIPQKKTPTISAGIFRLVDWYILVRRDIIRIQRTQRELE